MCNWFLSLTLSEQLMVLNRILSIVLWLTLAVVPVSLSMCGRLVFPNGW